MESEFLRRNIILTDRFGVIDIFSHTKNIADLFKISGRRDFYSLSLLLKKFLILFSFIHSIETLINGRALDHDKVS